MTVSEKVEKLNEYCKGSLGFQSYKTGWNISSFKDGTLFEVEGELYKLDCGFLQSKTFKGIVDLAYEEMIKDINKKKGGKRG